MVEYIKDPESIERKSFEIITDILGENDFDDIKASIVKRVIHTTADFEYASLLEFKPEVVTRILEALKSGCTIVSDTNMIKSGLNKKLSEDLNVKVECFVGSEEAFTISRTNGITRSMAAIDLASNLEGKVVFVIGNAPTALYRIMELAKENKIDPVAVIGVPVGFVGAEESKNDLWATNISSIITRGRKGGSTIAVAIVHAIMKEAKKQLGK